MIRCRTRCVSCGVECDLFRFSKLLVTFDLTKLISSSLQDYKESEDPKKFRSEKTGRGPLLERNWRVSCAV